MGYLICAAYSLTHTHSECAYPEHCRKFRNLPMHISWTWRTEREEREGKAEGAGKRSNRSQT